MGQDAVSPEFFALLGIPVLQGRAFSSQDRERSHPVAVVNQAFAREYFAGDNPIQPSTERAREAGRRWRAEDDEKERQREAGRD